jgi:hypothetical protein
MGVKVLQEPSKKTKWNGSDGGYTSTATQRSNQNPRSKSQSTCAKVTGVAAAGVPAAAVEAAEGHPAAAAAAAAAGAAAPSLAAAGGQAAPA